MRRRAGQAYSGRDATDGRDQLVDLVPHQESAIARLGTLSVFNLDGAGVLFHFRQGVDDLVPAEIAAGDLKDDILQKPGAQKPRRAAALSRGHDDGHLFHLVEVGDTHLQPFPHVGGKGAEGHTADDEGVDLPYRRHPAVFPLGPEQVFRRKNPAQQGAQLEFVTTGIQGRVCQHGNASEFDGVQDAVRIVAASTAATGHATLIDMITQFIDFFVPDRTDGAIRAGQLAHGAADARMGRIRLLIDAVIHGIDIARLFLKAYGDIEGPFSMNAPLNGPDRAHSSTASAKGAFILIPDDFPEKVLRA